VERVARYTLRPGRAGPAVGLQVGAGALAVLAATISGAMLPAAVGGWRLAPVAVAVLAFAMLPVKARAVLSTAALGYLLTLGFLVNRFGELSWHGAPDVGRLALVGGAAGVGSAIGAISKRPGRRPLTVTVYTIKRQSEYVNVREEVRSG